MFRSTQLLRRSSQIGGNEGEQDSRPVAILAHPYEAEAGILVPVLARFGFRVLEARDGAAALDLTHRHVTSLVVASSDMPHISGAQLCQKVRERNGLNTPFILISSPLNLAEFESELNEVLQSPPAPKPAPSEPPVPTEWKIHDVKEVGLAVPLLETNAIDSLLTPQYLAEHDVSNEGAALYKEAFVFLSSAVHAVDKSDRIDMEIGFDIAKRIAASLAADKSLLILSTDRASPFSFRQHSINVAILGTRIAQTLRLTEERQVRLCLAGMFHDLGNLKLPLNLTTKLTGFTKSEKDEMRRRPIYSSQLVSGYSGFSWLPSIVIQVYERENGSGYPYGLRSTNICEESRILGVADVFEACIHRRPQRAAMTGYHALEVMTAESDSFGDRTTKAMIRSFSVYPFNELVILNTGEIGKVIDINGDNPLRPTVRILYSVDKVELNPPRVIDLARNSQLWITAAITPDELPTGGR